MLRRTVYFEAFNCAHLIMSQILQYIYRKADQIRAFYNLEKL